MVTDELPLIFDDVAFWQKFQAVYLVLFYALVPCLTRMTTTYFLYDAFSSASQPKEQQNLILKKIFQSFHVFFTQYNYLTLLMFAMQWIRLKGEIGRKETLALQSVIHFIIVQHQSTKQNKKIRFFLRDLFSLLMSSYHLPRSPSPLSHNQA